MSLKDKTSRREPLTYLFRYFQKHPLIYVFGSLTVLITSTTEVFMPKVSQWTIDLLMKNGKPSQIPNFLSSDDPEKQILTLTLFLIGLMLVAVVMRAGWRQT